MNKHIVLGLSMGGLPQYSHLLHSNEDFGLVCIAKVFSYLRFFKILDTISLLFAIDDALIDEIFGNS